MTCYNYISMVSKASKNKFSVNYKSVGRQSMSFVWITGDVFIANKFNDVKEHNLQGKGYKCY
jgi:hypothetical protein